MSFRTPETEVYISEDFDNNLGFEHVLLLQTLLNDVPGTLVIAEMKKSNSSPNMSTTDLVRSAL